MTTVGEALSGGLHNAGCAVLRDATARCDCRKGDIWRALGRYAGHSKHDDWWCECGHPYRPNEEPTA